MTHHVSLQTFMFWETSLVVVAGGSGNFSIKFNIIVSSLPILLSRRLKLFWISVPLSTSSCLSKAMALLSFRSPTEFSGEVISNGDVGRITDDFLRTLLFAFDVDDDSQCDVSTNAVVHRWWLADDGGELLKRTEVAIGPPLEVPAPNLSPTVARLELSRSKSLARSSFGDPRPPRRLPDTLRSSLPVLRASLTWPLNLLTARFSNNIWKKLVTFRSKTC